MNQIYIKKCLPSFYLYFPLSLVCRLSLNHDPFYPLSFLQTVETIEATLVKYSLLYGVVRRRPTVVNMPGMPT